MAHSTIGSAADNAALLAFMLRNGIAVTGCSLCRNIGHSLTVACTA